MYLLCIQIFSDFLCCYNNWPLHHHDPFTQDCILGTQQYKPEGIEAFYSLWISPLKLIEHNIDKTTRKLQNTIKSAHSPTRLPVSSVVTLVSKGICRINLTVSLFVVYMFQQVPLSFPVNKKNLTRFWLYSSIPPPPPAISLQFKLPQ